MKRPVKRERGVRAVHSPVLLQEQQLAAVVGGALAAAPSAGVVENPLYTDPQTAGDNPLYV